MPEDEESFLDAVLQPADDAPRAKRSPWPAAPPGPPSDEGEEVGEAYKPDVVGPRIRNALRGGHGLAGSPKHYAVLVAVMVGLTSLPTWAVLHTGLRETPRVVTAPSEVFAVDPLPLPQTVVRGHVHAEKPPKPVRPKVRASHPVTRTPSRVRLPERSVAQKVPTERPVAKRTKPKRATTSKPAHRTRPDARARWPKRVVWSKGRRVQRPCHTWLPWKGPDHGHGQVVWLPPRS